MIKVPFISKLAICKTEIHYQCRFDSESYRRRSWQVHPIAGKEARSLSINPSKNAMELHAIDPHVGRVAGELFLVFPKSEIMNS